MTNQTIVAEKLLQVAAVKLNAQKPFTWTSGWKSPIYCDNRKVLGFPFERDYIKSELCNEIFSGFPEAELVAGVATAGIAWGAMAADQLKLPYCYVRSSAKAHGLKNKIEGYYQAGQKTIVVEDLISTGKSSMEAVEACIEEGLQVIGVVSIFNYEFDVAANLFAEKNITIKSLSNYSALLQVAAQQQIITEEQLQTLQQWRANPGAWTGA
jgi:orotate phosphoribosyltransferase